MNCNCNRQCRVCPNAVFSQSVSVVTVDGTDNLVIDLPARAYNDGQRYCIFVINNIPDTATILMPVSFSIGGDTTTVYPFTRCDCSQITACGVRTRTKYPVKVVTSANGGVFRSLSPVSCYPTNNLESLPVITPTATTTQTMGFATSKTTKNATTKKEVVSNE